MKEIKLYNQLPLVLSILFLLCTGIGIYLHLPLLIMVPPAIVFVIFSVQYPVILLYILIASIPWSIEFDVGGGFSTDIPDEPLMLLLAFTALGVVVYRRNEIRMQNIHLLTVIVALQFLWLVVTVIFSTNVFLSFKFLLAKSWYLLAFVAAPLLLIRDKRTISRASIVLLISMVVFMVLALIRHSQYDWSFEKINNALTPFFINHVNYSALLVLMVPLLFASAAFSKTKWFKTFILSVLVVTLVAIYFSYARGAWLALITGYAGYWVLKKKLLVWSYTAAIVFMFAAVFYLKSGDRYVEYSHDYKTTIFHTNFKEHLLATYKMKDVSTAERYYRWIAGVRMSKDSWKTGFGPNTFYHNYRSYTVPAFKTWVSVNEEKSTVHNYFLFLLIEQGVIGMLLFIFLLGAMFWYVQRIYFRTTDLFWKRVIAAIGVILVMICTVNLLSDLIESDKVGSIFFLSLAILIIADKHTRSSDPASNVEGIS